MKNKMPQVPAPPATAIPAIIPTLSPPPPRIAVGDDTEVDDGVREAEVETEKDAEEDELADDVIEDDADEVCDVEDESE